MNPDAPFTITVTANDSNVKEEEYARWQTQNSPCFPRPLCVSLPPKPPARQQSVAAGAAAAAAAECSAQDNSPSATTKPRGHDAPCRAPPARITRPTKMSAHSHLLLRVAQNANIPIPANRIQLNNQMDNLSSLQSSLSPKRPIRQKSVDADIAISNSILSESQHSMEFPILEVDHDEETASSFSSSSSSDDDDDDDDDDSCVSSSSSSSSSSCSIRREHSNNGSHGSRDLSPARPQRQKTMTFVEYGSESQTSLELVCALSSQQPQDSRRKQNNPASQDLNDSKDSLPAPPRRQKTVTVDHPSEWHDSQQSLELLALDDKEWHDSHYLYPVRVPRCQQQQQQQGGHDSSRDLSPSVPRRQQTVTVKPNPLELPLNLHDSDSRDLSPARPSRQKTEAPFHLEDEDDDELEDDDFVTTRQMMAAIRMLTPPRTTMDASSINSVPPGRKPSWVKLWESQGEANHLSATNTTKMNFWDME